MYTHSVFPKHLMSGMYQTMGYRNGRGNRTYMSIFFVTLHMVYMGAGNSTYFLPYLSHLLSISFASSRNSFLPTRPTTTISGLGSLCITYYNLPLEPVLTTVVTLLTEPCSLSVRILYRNLLLNKERYHLVHHCFPCPGTQ